MRFESKSLNVPAGAAPVSGTAARITDCTDKTIHIGGTITAGNVLIEVSIDGVTWATAQTASAVGVYLIPHVAKYMRVTKQAGMTGVPTVVLGFHNDRSV